MKAGGCPEEGVMSVPLFPLPNVVLFPRAVLPMHIFEERYKAMTADVLRGDRRVGMALLKPGWERSYYQSPAVEPVVCVGRILTHERLPDGQYNFLLQGELRARIVRETRNCPYRIAELEPLRDCPPEMEIDLDEDRRRLAELFGEELLGSVSTGRQFRQMLNSPMRTVDIADLLAFNFLEDVRLKQSLLSEVDVRRRVRRVIRSLESLRPVLEAASGWVKNPSLN